MNPSIAARILAGVLALGAAGTAQEQIDYSWSFESGNLISNWSFEEIADETSDNSPVGGMTVDERYKASDAPSGSFVMRVNTATSGTDDEGSSQATAMLRVKPSTTYRYSIKFKATSNGSDAGKPSFVFYKANKVSQVAFANPCPEYKNQASLNGQWKDYICDFTAPSEAVYSVLKYIRHDHSLSAGNTFYFDNVFLREKGKGEEIISTRRYGNAAGMVDQAILNDGTLDLVTQTDYDQFGRPSRSYLPFKNAALSNFEHLLVGVRASGEELNYDFSNLNDAYAYLKAYVASRPGTQVTSPQLIKVVVDPDNITAFVKAPDAFPVLYSSDNQPIFVKLQGIIRNSSQYQAIVFRNYSASNRKYTSAELASMAESQYGMANRPYSEAVYPAPWSNLAAQTAPPGPGFAPASGHLGQSGWAMTNSLSLPANPEVQTSTDNSEQSLVYRWSRDPMGGYRISWTEPNGNVVREAANFTDPGTWSINQYVHDSYGRLTEAAVPLGYYKNYDAYDGLGRLILENETDRGEREYTYDDFGRLTTISQFGLAPYTLMFQVHTDYDALNRVVATGHQKDKGFIFDELTPGSFQERTGISLATIGVANLKLANTRGKLACAFNKNSPVAAYLSGTPESRLVAHFYSYDADGRIAKVLLYIGAMKASTDRLQETNYAYDDLQRLERVTVRRWMGTSEVTEESNFVYDGMGRVVNVFDHLGRVKVDYRFDDLGRLSSADLYGKVRIDYEQDIQAKLRQIKYSSTSGSKIIYSENLGYETDVHSALPSDPTFVPRWDGKISAAFKNYGRELAQPVQLRRYQYGLAGHLTQSTQKQYPLSALSSNGDPDFASLGSPSSTANNTFQYDVFGRITRQTRDGYQFDHLYSNPVGLTHQVKSVTGTYPLYPRNMRDANNFIYDGAGRIVGDVSLGKSLYYNVDGQPIRVIKDGKTFLHYYDANGMRTAVWETTSGTGKVYVRFVGDDVAKEITQNNSGTVKTRNNVFGANSIVGYEETGLNNLRLLIKDNLGSAVKTIPFENPSSADHYTYRYSEYGIKTNLSVTAGDLGATGTFTGKEFNDEFKTYDFGARQYDPDLGMWLSPDPAEQYSNPYSYNGGDPINSIDPDGRMSGCVSSESNCQERLDAEEKSGLAAGKLVPLDKMLPSKQAASREIALPEQAVRDRVLPQTPAMGKYVGSDKGYTPDGAANEALSWQTPRELADKLMDLRPVGPDHFDNDYGRTVQSIRDASFETMKDNGGSFDTYSGELTAFHGDAHLWAVGYGFNTVSSAVPNSWGGVATLGLSLAVPGGLAAREFYVGSSMVRTMLSNPLPKIPGRVASRINIPRSQWNKHVVPRHLSGAKNASQFSLSQSETKSMLQSRHVVDTPISRIKLNDKGLSYVRDVKFEGPIGFDKFNGWQPTSNMTVLTDFQGNLVTATPGVIP